MFPHSFWGLGASRTGVGAGSTSTDCRARRNCPIGSADQIVTQPRCSTRSCRAQCLAALAAHAVGAAPSSDLAFPAAMVMPVTRTNSAIVTKSRKPKPAAPAPRAPSSPTTRAARDDQADVSTLLTFAGPDPARARLGRVGRAVVADRTHRASRLRWGGRAALRGEERIGRELFPITNSRRL